MGNFAEGLPAAKQTCQVSETSTATGRASNKVEGQFDIARRLAIFNPGADLHLDPAPEQFRRVMPLVRIN